MLACSRWLAWSVPVEREVPQRGARERDPRRQEGLQALRAMLADRLTDPPEFTDLAVLEEWTG